MGPTTQVVEKGTGSSSPLRSTYITSLPTNKLLAIAVSISTSIPKPPYVIGSLVAGANWEKIKDRRLETKQAIESAI